MEIIEILIIESNQFSWYKKHIGEKLLVNKEKTEDFHGKPMYIQSETENLVYVDHALTVVQQRDKKMKRII